MRTLPSKKSGERSRARAKRGERPFPRPTAAWLDKISSKTREQLLSMVSIKEVETH